MSCWHCLILPFSLLRLFANQAGGVFFVTALYVICAQCLIFLLNVFSVYTFLLVVVVATKLFLWMYVVQDPFEVLARLYHQFYPLYTTIWLFLFQIKWAWSVRPTLVSFSSFLSLSTRLLLLWHTVSFFVIDTLTVWSAQLVRMSKRVEPGTFPPFNPEDFSRGPPSATTEAGGEFR